MKNQLAILLATESNDALSISSCDGLKSCGAIGEKSLRGDLTDLDLKVSSFDDIGTSGPTGIWINSSDQNLWMTDGFRESPDPPFPFSRVAAITTNISLEHSVIVYHQISDGVLVEDIWQFANRIWIKSSIPIPTSWARHSLHPFGPATVAMVQLRAWNQRRKTLSMLDRWLVKLVRIG